MRQKGTLLDARHFGIYVALNGSFLLNFGRTCRDIKMVSISCPETSVRNCHCTMR